jgi:glycosyltransferase involved in cell wall biosynthesis
MARVLVVDEELPFPVNTGKRIRTYNLISRLANRFRIGFVCHRNADADEFDVASSHFADLGVDCHVIPRRLPTQSVLSGNWKFYAGLGWNLLSSRPYLVDKHDCRELRQSIQSLDQTDDVDLWHCEWTPYAATFLRSGMRNWVVSAHNVESQIWRRYWEQETNPLKRWYIRRQYEKFLDFERQAFTQAATSIVVSEPDAAIARKWFDANRVQVVDNGVDVDFFRPTDQARDPNELLYLGSLDWRPNLDAIEQLLDSIFPQIRTAMPKAKLTIVGRKPPLWLGARVQREPSVELHSDVPDVRPFLQRAGAMVVPLRVGGGSRLKILEALASGCPVISTKVGAEGLEVRPGVDLIQIDDIRDFATTTAGTLRDYSRLQAITANGCKRVRERYHWGNLAEKLGTIWESQLARIFAGKTDKHIAVGQAARLSDAKEIEIPVR